MPIVKVKLPEATILSNRLWIYSLSSTEPVLAERLITTPKAAMLRIIETLPKLKNGTLTPVSGAVPMAPEAMIKNCVPMTNAMPAHK